MLLSTLTISTSPDRGRGVFTTKNIPSGTVIEVSPVIELTTKERKQIEGTKLYHYIFEWGKSRRKAAMALGYISMYNHSFETNRGRIAEFSRHTKSSWCKGLYEKPI